MVLRGNVAIGLRPKQRRDFATGNCRMGQSVWGIQYPDNILLKLFRSTIEALL
jgi:hypothetical protein